MTTRTLGLDHTPLLGRLCEVLDSEPDPVKRQIAIELLIVSWANRMNSREHSLIVVDGIHKHVRQLIEQIWRSRTN